ncbi:TetR/AcrR family transcriptional regulator [Gordonia sp. HY002]|uniref:TetR/AcrR family transcriptional regulator n=1 Tax=Gordonia zhenghanii TaxID=2911516 RepID=UPI001EF0C9A1|nr:TetR/AcrR family transcriptional regulator [Gordonia zhenghanii]MCF8572159.1 TetR/AcrR family transcriptional regulator [Gordonia zhenghanii]MCF8606361.1 TetR/AcrR family transcriptional regulator [Gordonia zhenghanii]
MKAPRGRRLSPDARRAQILEVACRLFGERQFGDVWIDDLARESGISRGLLYHYFGGKQELLRVVFARESETFNESTRADPTLPLLEQLLDGLDKYLTYVKQHPAGYRTLQQQATMSDPAIQEIRRTNALLQIERILEGLHTADLIDAGDRAAVEAALTGWISLVTASCLSWMDSGQLSEEVLKRIWVNAGIGAVEGATGRPLPVRSPISERLTTPDADC